MLNGTVNNNEDFSIQGQFKILLDLLGDDITPEALEILTVASKSRKESAPLLYSTSDETITKADILSLLQSAATKKAEDRAARASTNSLHQNWPGTSSIKSKNGELLPTWIQFPYSRHSSLGELRAFVAAFRPKDVYQNTCDETTWTPQVSVEALYGDLCSERIFSHDKEVRNIYQRRVDQQLVGELNQQKNAQESQLRDFPSSGVECAPKEEANQPLPADTTLRTVKEEEEGVAWVVKTETISSSIRSVSISTERYSTQRYDSEVTPSPRSVFLRGKSGPAGGLHEPLSSPPSLPRAIKLEIPNIPALPSLNRFPSFTRPEIIKACSSQTSLPSQSVEETRISTERSVKRQKTAHDSSSTEQEDNPLLPFVLTISSREDIPLLPDVQCDEIPSFKRSPICWLDTLPDHVDKLVEETVEEDGSLDRDMIEEAMHAALGIGEKDWWNVELTINNFRYGPEEEL
jgi:hypothetical protein